MKSKLGPNSELKLDPWAGMGSLEQWVNQWKHRASTQNTENTTTEEAGRGNGINKGKQEEKIKEMGEELRKDSMKVKEGQTFRTKQ